MIVTLNNKSTNATLHINNRIITSFFRQHTTHTKKNLNPGLIPLIPSQGTTYILQAYCTYSTNILQLGGGQLTHLRTGYRVQFNVLPEVRCATTCIGISSINIFLSFFLSSKSMDAFCLLLIKSGWVLFLSKSWQCLVKVMAENLYLRSLERPPNMVDTNGEVATHRLCWI